MTLWISADLSKSRSGVAVWDGLAPMASPALLSVIAIVDADEQEVDRMWCGAFMVCGVPVCGLVIEGPLAHNKKTTMVLSEHRGMVLTHWRAMQGHGKPVIRKAVSEWREAVRKTLPCIGFAAGDWMWPDGTEAKKARAIEVVNLRWPELALEPHQDDEAEAVLVGHWAHVSGTLRGELRRIADAAAKEQAKAERARIAAEKAAEKAARLERKRAKKGG
jgi:hypothetical protein